jgi:hypothetical protein
MTRQFHGNEALSVRQMLQKKYDRHGTLHVSDHVSDVSCSIKKSRTVFVRKLSDASAFNTFLKEK